MCLPNEQSVCGESRDLLDSGRQAQRQGRGEVAYESFRRAYELSRQRGDRQGTAYAALELAHNVQFFVPPDVSDIFHYREERSTEAFGLFREVGDDRGVACALRVLSTCLGQAEAVALLEESLAILRRVGDVTGTIRTLEALGTRMCVQGKRDEGVQHKLEALRLARSCNDGEAVAEMCLSVAVSWDGDLSESIAFFEEAQGLFRCRREWGRLYQSLLLCANLACDDARADRREAYLREALTTCRRMGDARSEMTCLAQLADLAERRGGSRHADVQAPHSTAVPNAAETSTELRDVSEGDDPDRMIELMRRTIDHRMNKGKPT